MPTSPVGATETEANVFALFNSLFKTQVVGMDDNQPFLDADGSSNYSEEWQYLSSVDGGLYAFNSTKDDNHTILTMPRDLDFSFLSESVKKLLYGLEIDTNEADDILTNQIDYAILVENYNMLSSNTTAGTGNADVKNPLFVFGSQNASTSRLSDIATNGGAQNQQATTQSRYLGTDYNGVVEGYAVPGVPGVPGSLSDYLAGDGTGNTVKFIRAAGSGANYDNIKQGMAQSDLTTAKQISYRKS